MRQNLFKVTESIEQILHGLIIVNFYCFQMKNIKTKMEYTNKYCVDNVEYFC